MTSTHLLPYTARILARLWACDSVPLYANGSNAGARAGDNALLKGKARGKTTGRLPPDLDRRTTTIAYGGDI